MSRAQGYELIGIAWLALAAFDKPIDWGSLAYMCLAIWAFVRAIDSWANSHPRGQITKERT